MKNFDTKQIELHVTHACNFSCEGCSHYSNHGHSGTLTLETAKEWLYVWGQRIRPKTFVILGGEPTLNKELVDIVYLIRMIYPDPYTQIDLVSNASFLHLHPRLPKALIATETNLAISIHSTKHKNYIKKFKSGYTLAKEWKHSLGVHVEFWDYTNEYWTPQYNGFGNNMFPYEDKNPLESWKKCVSKYAIQLHENKLWKCPALAYLPMQAKKYNLSDKWNPYLKYKPLEPNCSDDELEEFLSRKDELYCSMCPANQTKNFIKEDPTLPVSYWEKKYDHLGDIIE